MQLTHYFTSQNEMLTAPLHQSNISTNHQKYVALYKASTQQPLKRLMLRYTSCLQQPHVTATITQWIKYKKTGSFFHIQNTDGKIMIMIKNLLCCCMNAFNSSSIVAASWLSNCLSRRCQLACMCCKIMCSLLKVFFSSRRSCHQQRNSNNTWRIYVTVK